MNKNMRVRERVLPAGSQVDAEGLQGAADDGAVPAVQRAPEAPVGARPPGAQPAQTRAGRKGSVSHVSKAPVQKLIRRD